jgi:hypothetical protein
MSVRSMEGAVGIGKWFGYTLIAATLAKVLLGILYPEVAATARSIATRFILAVMVGIPTLTEISTDAFRARIKKNGREAEAQGEKLDKQTRRSVTYKFRASNMLHALLVYIPALSPMFPQWNIGRRASRIRGRIRVGLRAIGKERRMKETDG